MYPQQVPPEGPMPGQYGIQPQQAQPVPPPAPPPKPVPVVIRAQEGSPLAELLDRRDAAKAQLKEIEGEVERWTAEIKTSLTSALEGAEVIDIDSPGRRRLRLAYRQGWRVDTDRLRRELRDVWLAYRKPTKGYWELRELSGD